MAKRNGQTITPDKKIYINKYAAVGGKKEMEGPLGQFLDLTSEDNKFDQPTWEKSESKMQELAIKVLIKKSGYSPSDIDIIFGGDLLNQCIGSSYGVRNLGIPFAGLYGACSTMALSSILATMAIESGFAKRSIGVTSSHFCSAERQFRFPLEYGSQRTENNQWTVTGSGAVLISEEKSDIYISHCTLGKITDYNISDMNNMGAAMAPSAADTLLNFFKDTNTTEKDYDYIFTGDLGSVGKKLLITLMNAEGYNIENNYNDCGCLIYKSDDKDIKSGASGCGCSAVTLCTYILPKLERGDFKKVIFMATGALMSPTSSQQGESIPGIAHLLVLEREE